MRSLDATFDLDTVATIDERLNAVETSERVCVVWAIESGSRAWGFPSPDSDYDCRFLFVRKRVHYVSLFPPRDVIETPLTKVFDVNGWDLAKALRLLLKGNAVILEWLTSQNVYRGDKAFRDEFLVLAGEVADRDRIARHYLHLGRGQLSRFADPAGEIPLKKLFYILRPAIALRWLRQHSSASFPPMNLQQLVQGAGLPDALVEKISDLALLKSKTREMGTGSVPAELRAFWEAEFKTGESAFRDGGAPSNSHISQADAFFRRCLDRFG
jgi:uncharacterized protein